MNIEDYRKLNDMVSNSNDNVYLYKSSIKSVLGFEPDNSVLSAIGLTPMFMPFCSECRNADGMIHMYHRLCDVVEFDQCANCGAEFEFNGAQNCFVEFKTPIRK